MALVLEGLRSYDAAHRANALETLDSLGERALIRPLLRVWETTGVAFGSGVSLVEALRDSDPWIRACAAFAAAGSEDPALRSMLQELTASDPDGLVRETAATALTLGPPGSDARQADRGVVMDTLPAVSVMERVVFLRRVPLFAHLAPIEIKQVATIASERIFANGEVLCRQGEPGDEMCIIVAGEVRVIITRSDGSTAEIARRGAGECVGEMAILAQDTRIATLIAIGSVRTLTIGQQDFERILRERPETGLAVIRELCARLKHSEPPAASPGPASPDFAPPHE